MCLLYKGSDLCNAQRGSKAARSLAMGTLRVTLVSAKDLNDKDWFGKMDPYAVLELGSCKQKSSVHKRGGKNPIWHQDFTFALTGESNMTITLYDKDLISDDYIGKCTVLLDQVRGDGSGELELPVVTARQTHRGLLTIKLEFTEN